MATQKHPFCSRYFSISQKERGSTWAGSAGGTCTNAHMALKPFPKFLQWKLDLYLQIIYIRMESVSQSWEQWGTAGMVKVFKVMVKRQCMEKQMF